MAAPSQGIHPGTPAASSQICQLPAGDLQDPPSGRKRKLKRNVSCEVTPVSVEQRLCIKGGVRKEWLVLPQERIHGRICVSVTQSTCWLHHMLGGRRGCSEHGGAVSNFMRECLFMFRTSQSAEGTADTLADQGGATAVDSTASGQELSVGAAATSQGMTPASSQVVTAGNVEGAARKKGRQAILSESGSDGEASDEQQKRHVGKRKQCRVHKEQPKTGEFVCAQVRGIDLTFTIGRGPRVVFPVDGPWIQQVVDELLPRAGEVRSSGRSASSQEDPKSALTELDAGRIMWRPLTVSTQPAWTLVYHTAEGEKKTRGASTFSLSLRPSSRASTS